MPADPDRSAAIPVIARRLPAAAAIQKQALRLRLLDCFGAEALRNDARRSEFKASGVRRKSRSDVLSRSRRR